MAFEGTSRTPTNFVTAQPGDALNRALGIVWLLALMSFLAAAVLLDRQRGLAPVAVVAAAVSMVPVALWWKNAPMGAVANALVVAAVLLAPRFEGLPA